MHFVAMLGFGVVGSPIRYDVGLTAASAIIAVVTVGVGLMIALVGSGAKRIRIVIGGVLAGLGVAAMHYTGMAAMRLDGQVDYGTPRVAISVAIAVVAASVALWLTVTVQRPSVIFVSALIMGVAVNGMHFTGMSAMSVHVNPSIGPLSGAKASSLLIPIGLAVIFAVLGLVYALMAAPTDEDRAGAAYLAARLAAGEAAAGAKSGPPPVPFGGAPRPAPGNEPRPSSASAAAPAADNGTLPRQRQPGRMPTTGSSWTFRDRTLK